MRRNLIIAVLFLMFEAYVGDGFIGMSCGTILALVFTIRAFTEKERRSEMLRVAVIYVLVVVATVTLLSTNIRVAQRRAAPVISAVKQYHSEHGNYPKTLDELVPTYIPYVPHAGFTLLSRDFRYVNREHAELYFPAMVHGVFFYDFVTETWRTND